MDIHEEEITVSQADLDARNHVNNVRYVQWVQDMAESHWLLKSSEATRNKFYWVMISHHIQYKGEALLGDKLLLKTYVKETKGVKSVRMVEIYMKNSLKLLTTSETIWCYMSHDTHRPARIPEDIQRLFS
ncbi:MAG: acyl-CoA thioesterase [Algicola sp.]|nr:acyl-CoA thioesterase [Algicola sp.]